MMANREVSRCLEWKGKEEGKPEENSYELQSKQLNHEAQHLIIQILGIHIFISFLQEHYVSA